MADALAMQRLINGFADKGAMLHRSLSELYENIRDFFVVEEAGELTLFINESQISFLESLMRSEGTLDSKQMAGAFQLLRSNDLIWSRIVNEYLMGEREDMTDLMAWNADATRMPYRMHSEYLRQLFLNNDLAEGRFIAGPNFAISDPSERFKWVVFENNEIFHQGVVLYAGAENITGMPA